VFEAIGVEPYPDEMRRSAASTEAETLAG